jgi:diguanylate cyclase (GGDEF)-like protein/PAS domain S-box-containing protein
VDSPVYQRIKTHLLRIRPGNDQIRFLYLMGRRPDGIVYFLVDSEPPESPDISPPGQIYHEASPSIHEVFTTRQESVTGPETDRWGTWISALIPLLDPASGKPVAVFGMDIDSGDWWQHVALHSATPISVAILLSGLLTTLFILYQRVAREKNIIVTSGMVLQRYEQIVSSNQDRMALIDRNYTFLIVNDAYLKAFNKTREEIVGHTLPGLYGQEFFLTHQKPAFDRALGGQNEGYEAWNDLPGLGRRFYSVRYTPYLEDGQVHGVVATVRDITDQKLVGDEESRKTRLTLLYKENLLALSRKEFSKLKDYFRAITETGSRTLNAERVSIWTLHRNTFKCLDQYQATTGEHQSGTVFTLPASSPYLNALEQHEVIRADDARTDPRTREFTTTLFEPLDIYSTIIVPVWRGGRVQGVLRIEHTGSQRRWTELEEEFAISLATMVSVAMETSERLNAQTDLKHTAEAVARGGGERFLEQLVRSVAEVLKMEYCLVGLVDSDNLHIRTIVNLVNGELHENFIYKLAGTPCEQITTKGECVYPNAVQKQFPKDSDLATLQIKSYAGVPLSNSAGRIIGLLTAFSPHPIKDPEHTLSLLRIFAARAANELERNEVDSKLRDTNELLQNQLAEIGTLQKELREQSIRDPLTGLFNRRYLEETLRRELSRAKRNKHQLSVALLDIDYFKPLNDTHGHDAGDIMLKSMALLLRNHTRDEDVVCRYGGEEFVVVLPATTLEHAHQRMEQLRFTIEQLRVPFDRIELNTTVSIGIAAYPRHGETLAALLKAADMVLYEAKGAGRNHVMSAQNVAVT